MKNKDVYNTIKFACHCCYRRLAAANNINDGDCVVKFNFYCSSHRLQPTPPISIYEAIEFFAPLLKTKLFVYNARINCMQVRVVV